MKQAIIDGYAGVLVDDGTIGKLLSGADGAEYWESKNTACTGSFAVNPAVSRFLLAGAKRTDDSFVVDSLSTDGVSYPGNVIIENSLILVKFDALSPNKFAVKSSLNGARALGLPSGTFIRSADADISILDFTNEKALATVVGGKVITLDVKLLGSGTPIICDERGVQTLKKAISNTSSRSPFRLIK